MKSGRMGAQASPLKGRNEMTRKSMAQRALAPTAVVALVFGFAACGHHDAAESADEPIAECVGYVAAYRTCLNAAGSAAAAETGQRVAALERGVASSRPRTDAERADLRERCASGAARLKTACR